MRQNSQKIMVLLTIVIAISVVSLLFAAYLASNIIKKPEGDGKVKEIAKAIHEGAMAFLNKEYRILAIFIVVVTVILYTLIGKEIAIAFVIGGVLSALAGN